MITSWIFEFFDPFHPSDEPADLPQRTAADFIWYLDHWQRAEAQGFTGIFFSEHHFVPGRFSPAPNLLIAAVAARTSTLRLGVMGQVLPFHEPWHLAEQCAMLDQLSGGRLEIGFSSGVGPREFERVGLASDEIRPRYAEAVEIIEKALSQERFSHQGQFWSFENLVLAPRPLQQPMPPRWVTGLSPETAASSGREGRKFCTGFGPVARVRTLFDAFRAGAVEVGREVGPSDLGLRRQVFISDSIAEAREIGEQALADLHTLYSAPPRSATAAVGGNVAPDAPSPGQAHASFIGDEENIAGTPAEVAEQVIEQCRAVGAGHILAYVPRFISRVQHERCHELWAEVNAVLAKAEMG